MKVITFNAGDIVSHQGGKWVFVSSFGFLARLTKRDGSEKKTVRLNQISMIERKK